MTGTGTDADKFEKFYQALIKKLQDKKIKVFISTPAVIGEKWDGTNELDSELNKYSDIIRRVAQAHNPTLIDLRKSFLDYLKETNKDNKTKDILTYDGVHLNKAGDQFVAERMYEALHLNYLKAAK